MYMYIHRFDSPQQLLEATKAAVAAQRKRGAVVDPAATQGTILAESGRADVVVDGQGRGGEDDSDGSDSDSGDDEGGCTVS